MTKRKTQDDILKDLRSGAYKNKVDSWVVFDKKHDEDTWKFMATTSGTHLDEQQDDFYYLPSMEDIESAVPSGSLRVAGMKLVKEFDLNGEKNPRDVIFLMPVGVNVYFGD